MYLSNKVKSALDSRIARFKPSKSSLPTALSSGLYHNRAANFPLGP